MKIIYNKKIYYPVIFLIVIYLLELNLFFKSFNGEYLSAKFKDQEIVSLKFFNNFISLNNVHLSVFSDEEVKIYCNKDKSLTHNFDKFGFLNINSSWDHLNEYVILKSYSELNCNDFNLKESKKFFLKSKKKLDLSSISSGPLHQYSILKEYSKNIKTKKVFWFHFEGSDLSDSNNTKNNKLKNYFENNLHDQNLSQYNVALKRNEIKKHLKNFNTTILKQEIKNTLLLYRTINFFKIKNDQREKVIINNEEFIKSVKNFNFSEIEDLVQILNKANIFLKEKNIEFIFFYLPRKSENYGLLKNVKIKENLFKGLNDHNIKFFDLTEKKYKKKNKKIYLDELI